MPQEAALVTMGCSDSVAGALLAGGALGFAAVAFSHELGGVGGGVCPPSTAPSQNMFEQPDNLGGWIGAVAPLGSPLKMGGVQSLGEPPRVTSAFLYCCPDGISGHPYPLRA